MTFLTLCMKNPRIRKTGRHYRDWRRRRKGCRPRTSISLRINEAGNRGQQINNRFANVSSSGDCRLCCPIQQPQRGDIRRALVSKAFTLSRELSIRGSQFLISGRVSSENRPIISGRSSKVELRNPSLMRRLPRWLEFWIALSAAVALISTSAVIFYALGKLASEVNNIDLALTRQSTQAAIRAFETRLSENLQDYANWDDAALKLYNTPDAELVSDILKDVTETGTVFDTAFLIDEKGRSLEAYHNGQALSSDSNSFFGSSFTELMQGFSANSMEYRGSSGLIASSAGIAAVAVGLVMPFSKNLQVPKNQMRLLVIAKHLTEENVERLRNEFVIPGLDFINDDRRVEYTVPLIDPTGATIGSLGWTKRSPGTVALKKISPAVWLILALLSAVTCGIIIFACINVRYAYRSRLRAEHAATHDFLTGLPNRAALKAIFEEKGNSNNLETHNSAVVFFDLDGFKQVNDAYGHDVGDRLLRA